MGRKARTKCKICGETIEVGKRAIHLLEKHKMMPPKTWLRNHGLNIIAEALKKDPDLRKTLFKWMSQYFDFDP